MAKRQWPSSSPPKGTGLTQWLVENKDILNQRKAICGIYRISVIRPDGPTRYYIGQASSIFGRWSSHLWWLRRHRHYNLGMQVDFREYGEAAFLIEILEECPRDKKILAQREQAAVDSHDQSLLYNIRLQCVTSGLGVPASPERKAKIAAKLTGIRRSDETKAAISRAQAWKHTPEGKAKMSAAAKGRKASDETKAKMSQTTYFRRMPSEVHQKSSASLRLRTLVLKYGSAWILHA